MSAGAYGIGEAVAQVLDYLDCVYSQQGAESIREGSSTAPKIETGGHEEELLGVYRHLLDGQGAAPGP